MKKDIIIGHYRVSPWTWGSTTTWPIYDTRYPKETHVFIGLYKWSAKRRAKQLMKRDNWISDKAQEIGE